MPEYTLPAEKEQINDVIEEASSIHKQRAYYERQWLINIAFLYGKHHFTVEQKPSAGLDERIVWELKMLERKNKVRRTSNYILPLFRSLLAKMILMKSHVSVDATTNADKDRSAAKVSSEASEDFWQNVNKHNPILSQKTSSMMMVILRLFTYMLSLGSGYLHPVFNPKARATAFLNGQVIPDAEIGEVETRVLHHFNCLKDPLGQFYIMEDLLPIDYIENLWGAAVEEEDVQQPDYEKRLISMLEATWDAKIKNAARVYQKWALPSKKYPEGRWIILTKNKIIFDGKLPKEYRGKLPFFQFDFLDFLLAPFAQGAVEQLIHLQEDYNFTLTRLAGYKKWMAGKVLIPRGSKMSAKWDDEIGQILFYDAGHGIPKQETPPSAPAFLIDELVRIRRDMEDIAGSHDTSMGRTPTGVKSGVGIENMIELDTSQMAPNMMVCEQQLAYFMETVLNIMEERYSEKRLLEITGEQLAVDINSFIGSDLMGNRRIKVSLGSSLPFSKEARQAKIEEWEQRGYITKDKARELLEFGDIEGVFHSIDETAEKSEIQQLMRPDIQVVVEPWEEHNIRVKVLTDFMKTEQFMKLPEPIRQKFIQHLEAHQAYIRQEHAAAAKLAGGVATPPSSRAAPQMI